MKQSKYIPYSAILLCLFWLFGTFSTAFAGHKPLESKKDKSQTEISVYQAKALVPVAASAIISPSYVLIFEFTFLVSNFPNQTFQKPIFKISFFEKVFEHIIAPQAP